MGRALNARLSAGQKYKKKNKKKERRDDKYKQDAEKYRHTIR
jgi:hypothetical protein